ncbi:MAG: N-acetyl-gamma-glutamyl-phosphate reductase [Bacteroidia bacterium]
MIQVGIVGSGGYVAGELIRCLLHHPNVQIDFAFSHSQAGKAVSEIHEDLYTFPELRFSGRLNPHVDVLFLCLGHGNSCKFLSENTFSEQTVIIDLSNDFRLEEDALFQDKAFVYGLVEARKAGIKDAMAIANPGCFATAIQLGILPLAQAGLLQTDVHVHALTGSTGAGQSLTKTSHFSWRNNNVSVYKAFRHQHLGEIEETVRSYQKGFRNRINFLPIRGDFARGIFATIYTQSDLSEQELRHLYQDFYKDAPFTFVTDKTVNIKQVVNTNNCLLQVQKIDDKVLITSAIDNLLKGAAGQAIQNMNLILGLKETTGLHFKASYF